MNSTDTLNPQTKGEEQPETPIAEANFQWNEETYTFTVRADTLTIKGGSSASLTLNRYPLFHGWVIASTVTEELAQAWAHDVYLDHAQVWVIRRMTQLAEYYFDTVVCGQDPHGKAKAYIEGKEAVRTFTAELFLLVQKIDALIADPEVQEIIGRHANGYAHFQGERRLLIASNDMFSLWHRLLLLQGVAHVALVQPIRIQQETGASNQHE